MMVLSVFQELYENVMSSSWLEAVAVVTGLLSVWFAKKENILVYPTGIVSVLIYVYLCLSVKLYADMGINAFYFVMSVYGWVKWSRKTGDMPARPITWASRKEWIFSVVGVVVFFIILVFILKNYTDSNVPVWDAFTTAIFIIGMWLMALKKIENWLAWIIGDLICIPLFASKGLILTSFQYTVFLILAILGYLEWRSKFKVQSSKFKVGISQL
jgi:nicotinamide mononucleotide transporter